MSALYNVTMLLDQVADFTAMGEHFRAESAKINIPHLFILAAVVLTIVSSIWALSRWKESAEQTWKSDSPQKLFLELCRTHQLSKEQMALLRRIVRELHLAQPAALFVDPGHLVSVVHLDKFQGATEELRKIGEAFFGYHLWRQAQASHATQL